MKAKVTLSILLSVLFSYAFAQQLFVGSYVENTCINAKLGTRIGLLTNQEFEVGGFYQSESKIFQSEENKPLFYEKEFFGVFMAAPLLVRDHYQLKLNVRTGAVNKINFAITPSIVMDYKLFNQVSLNGGIGVKALKPTLQAGIRINIL